MKIFRGSDLANVEKGGSDVASAGVGANVGAPTLAGVIGEGVLKQLEVKTEGFKVAVAQMKPLATRLKENTANIKSYIDKALNEGANLVVFPELAIPGYLVLDLSNDIDFVRDNIKALKEVVEYTRGKNITVVTGFIDYEENNSDTKPFNFYNSAAVISKGRIQDVIDKTLLPDYDIFWDHRYFKSAEERHVIEINGHKIGIQICEDLWDKNYSTKVSDELKQLGAEVIINLSASPFHTGKYALRQDLVTNSAVKQEVPVIYSNMVGVQDGYEGEVVFDGRSMICLPDGKTAAIGAAFKEDLLVVDLAKPKEVLLPEWAPVSEVYHGIVLGIREYAARNGFKRAYIGLSGGIDSEVVSALAVAALGPENVIGVTMPMDGITSSDTKNDAIRGAVLKGIRCDVRPIRNTYDAWYEEASKVHEKFERLTKQNKQPQFRGQILTEYTHQDREGFIISTGNKTEAALGYMTLYGDMCGGLAAILDVSKLMVYELADFINKINERETIPFSVITRIPSAELEPDQEDKTDLPADYPVLSPLVDELVEKQKTRTELYEIYGQEIVDKTARMIARAEYKRRQAPPAIRVTSKAFGAGRRIPLDSVYF